VYFITLAYYFCIIRKLQTYTLEENCVMMVIKTFAKGKNLVLVVHWFDFTFVS